VVVVYHPSENAKKKSNWESFSQKSGKKTKMKPPPRSQLKNIERLAPPEKETLPIIKPSNHFQWSDVC